MKAILHTRCGCSQEQPTSFPPPHDIHVAMKMGLWTSEWSDRRHGKTDHKYTTRRFKLVDVHNEWNDEQVAHYMEEL